MKFSFSNENNLRLRYKKHRRKYGWNSGKDPIADPEGLAGSEKWGVGRGISLPLHSPPSVEGSVDPAENEFFT